MSDLSISAIITTYNRRDLVKLAIRSVLQQTRKVKEIIVVDDCSPYDISQEIESLSNIVRVVRNSSNKGVSFSRNRGVQIATGDYVAFLDDDDEWLPNKSDVQLRYMRKNMLCLCGFLSYQTRIPYIIRGIDEITAEVLRRQTAFPTGGPSGLLCRRELFNFVQFDEKAQWAEDRQFLIRALDHSAISYAPAALVLYREPHGGDSLSDKVRELDPSGIEKQFKILEKHRALLGEKAYRHRLAAASLAHIRQRRNRMQLIGYAVRQAGLTAILGYLWSRICARLRYVVARRANDQT